MTVFILDDGNNLQAGTSLADAILGKGGSDTLLGGGGNDNILAGSGNDFLFGQDGDDSLTAGTGNDVVTGGVGNDFLSGVEGDNQFPGFGERDTLTGESGADTFALGHTGKIYYGDAISSPLGVGSFAVLSDFNPSQDKIQLAGSSSQYVLALPPTGVGNFGLSTKDTGIYLKVGQAFDLIGIVPDVNTELISSAFKFV